MGKRKRKRKRKKQKASQKATPSKRLSYIAPCELQSSHALPIRFALSRTSRWKSRRNSVAMNCREAQATVLLLYHSSTTQSLHMRIHTYDWVAHLRLIRHTTLCRCRQNERPKICSSSRLLAKLKYAKLAWRKQPLGAGKDIPVPTRSEDLWVRT